MKISEIKPFIRYAHYVPIDKNSDYRDTIPYDNRIFYMYKGTASINTEKECYTMNEGDIIIIPSGHKYRLLPSDAKAVYIALNFDYTQANIEKQNLIYPAEATMYDYRLKLENINFFDVVNFNTITFIKGMNELAGKFVRIEYEYSQKLLYFEAITSNALTQLLLECARRINGQSFPNNKEVISMIIGYIHENMEKSLSNKTIAQNFNLHPNYISNIMKAYTGLPLHQYLLKIRISHSIELISQKKYSLTKIAEKCGFSDIYHYSKSFKKIIGVSPSAYEKSTMNF